MLVNPSKQSVAITFINWDKLQADREDVLISSLLKVSILYSSARDLHRTTLRKAALLPVGHKTPHNISIVIICGESHLLSPKMKFCSNCWNHEHHICRQTDGIGELMQNSTGFCKVLEYLVSWLNNSDLRECVCDTHRKVWFPVQRCFLEALE